MVIRPEEPSDIGPIAALIDVAFEGHPHSEGTEAQIVAHLRGARALFLSLVAEENGLVVGCVALSPVTIEGLDVRWYALGPIAVAPERQRRGIGSALVRDALSRLDAHGADGCLLVGEPSYYARLGFTPASSLGVAEPLQPYLQTRIFRGAEPRGRVHFHPAFDSRP